VKQEGGTRCQKSQGETESILNSSGHCNHGVRGSRNTKTPLDMTLQQKRCYVQCWEHECQATTTNEWIQHPANNADTHGALGRSKLRMSKKSECAVYDAYIRLTCRRATSSQSRLYTRSSAYRNAYKNVKWQNCRPTAGMHLLKLLPGSEIRN